MMMKRLCCWSPDSFAAERPKDVEKRTAIDLRDTRSEPSALLNLKVIGKRSPS